MSSMVLFASCKYDIPIAVLLESNNVYIIVMVTENDDR